MTTKPWEETWSPGDNVVHSEKRDVADTQWIAEWRKPDDDQAELDARFIAAAPDMARALLAADETIASAEEADESGLPPDPELVVMCHRLATLRETIDAALRKAGVR